jgi:hypothetical protein
MSQGMMCLKLCYMFADVAAWLTTIKSRINSNLIASPPADHGFALQNNRFLYQVPTLSLQPQLAVLTMTKNRFKRKIVLMCSLPCWCRFGAVQ